MEQKRIIEALLFASQDPLPPNRIQAILESDNRPSILKDIRELKEEYEAMGRAYHLVEVAGGFQLRTRTEMAPWLKKLKKQKSAKLSRPTMETLSIIAYKQPVTRGEIEFIRGVGCGAILRALLEKGVIKILGKKDVPGKPLLYGTTKKFLEVFGLKDLSSLPDLRQIQELEEEDDSMKLPLFAESAKKTYDRDDPDETAGDEGDST